MRCRPSIRETYRWRPPRRSTNHPRRDALRPGPRRRRRRGAPGVARHGVGRRRRSAGPGRAPLPAVRRPARSWRSRPVTSSARSTSRSATGTLIAAHVSLSVGMAPGQPLPPGATSPVLRVGDRCSIGRGSHLVAHRSVVIGDDVMTGPHCYITDQNHVYADPEVPVGQQWPADDPVVIGAGSWLGAGAIDPPWDPPRAEHRRRRRRRRARRLPRPRGAGRGARPR